MHEHSVHCCLFGCSESKDDLDHYLQCSPLWQIASQALGVQDPFNLEERLCLKLPSVGRAQLLALVFLLYHFAHSKARNLTSDAIPNPREAQNSIFQAARTFIHHVTHVSDSLAVDYPG